MSNDEKIIYGAFMALCALNCVSDVNGMRQTLAKRMNAGITRGVDPSGKYSIYTNTASRITNEPTRSLTHLNLSGYVMMEGWFSSIQE